ncbi:MAG TPA: hypothetical protein VFR24_22720 [Candidatus Angelobacter sp.]|jgi:hypothetical protein|nr:hypothetical protein [Candidatus Angelobacter sp.]
MSKPAGVIVIAILYFLGAGLLLLLGIGFVVGGGAIATMMSQQNQAGGGLATLMGALGAGVGIFFLVCGVLDALIGIGLLKLKNWARIVAIVFAAIGACFQIFGLLTSLAHFNPFSFIIGLIVLGVQALIIWYLLKPEVKAAFQGAQARAVSA